MPPHATCNINHRDMYNLNDPNYIDICRLIINSHDLFCSRRIEFTEWHASFPRLSPLALHSLVVLAITFAAKDMDSRSVATRGISSRPFRVRGCARESFCGGPSRAYSKWFRIVGVCCLLV